MNKKQLSGTLLTLLLCWLMTACAPSLVLTGEKTEAIQPDEVRLYFTERPECEYERVGYLSVRGGYYSRASLFEALQQRAARVGADGVFVQEIRRLDILEFVGSAIAIRCNQAQKKTDYLSSSSLPSSSSSPGRSFNTSSNTSSRSLGVSTTVSSSSINPTSKKFCLK